MAPDERADTGQIPCEFEEIERQYAEARGRDPPTGYDLLRRMAKYVARFDNDAEVERWVSEFESRPDRFAVDPTDIRDDSKSETVLANRPPWQLRQMRLALRIGWFPDSWGKSRTTERNQELRDIRGAITGWTTQGRQWCSICQDRAWCRAEQDYGRCSKETYKPKGAVYKATEHSLGFLLVGEIITVVEFGVPKPGAVAPHISDDENEALDKFDRAVLQGLKDAGAVFDVEEEYDFEDIPGALEEVHAQLMRLSDDADVLAVVTRALNAEVSGPRSDARRRRRAV